MKYALSNSEQHWFNRLLQLAVHGLHVYSVHSNLQMFDLKYSLPFIQAHVSHIGRDTFASYMLCGPSGSTYHLTDACPKCSLKDPTSMKWCNCKQRVWQWTSEHHKSWWQNPVRHRRWASRTARPGCGLLLEELALVPPYFSSNPFLSPDFSSFVFYYNCVRASTTSVSTIKKNHFHSDCLFTLS